MDAKQKIAAFVTMPVDYELVSVTQGKRNQKSIAVYRYQQDGAFELNGPRITALYADEQLVSLKAYHTLHPGSLLREDEAVARANEIWQRFDPKYAAGLSYLRLENQTREVLIDGKPLSFPVQWIKFGHHNGSYNWVTLGGNGDIVELEIDSRWDYFRGRRKTEMWDNDDWVLAHEGRGPQLNSPNALA